MVISHFCPNFVATKRTYHQNMKRIVLSIALASCLFTTQAQENTFKPFKQLDFGVTLGTTGIGFDVTMPIQEIVKLRTGFEVMPRFNYDMHFNVESFDGEGTPTGSTLDRMSEVLYGLTGFRVDQNVTMKGKPTMWNFKFLVEEDSPSLFAVGMYNHLYDVAYKDWELDIPTPIIDTETTGAVYLDPQIEVRLLKMGRMGIPLGKFTHDMTDVYGQEHKQGETYYMEPDEYSMVSAEARANSFKPYLGFGYEGRLIKNNDTYHIGFDAGVMIWGGTPSIMTHEGINLAKDVEGIGGKVGSYVDLVKAFKVFPVINLRITRTIF